MTKENLAAGVAVPLAALGAAAAMAFASSKTLGATAAPGGTVLAPSAGLLEVVAGNRLVVPPPGWPVTAVMSAGSSSAGGSTSTNTGW
jgi:hypothetical protein